MIWVMIFLFSRTNYCPDRLPADYYYCESNEECFLHPKYDCINQKPLNCFIKEDLSASQEAASILMCDCVNKRCETKVIR